MIIAQLSISQVGEGLSLSRYIKEVIKILRNSDVKFETNSMSTIIETNNLNSLFRIIENLNEHLFKLCVKRVITDLKIDFRKDKDATMESKLKSIN